MRANGNNYIFRPLTKLVFTGHSLIISGLWDKLFCSFKMVCKLDFVNQSQEMPMRNELPYAD